MKISRSSSLQVLVLLVLGTMAAFKADAAQTNHFSQFAVGSDGFQANVPPLAVNLLADPTVTFGTSGAANGGGGSSTNFALLADGSYGLVPASGGGGPGEVSINSNTTLTYTFASSVGYNLTRIDVFSGWGDNGRVNQTYIVNVSTTIPPVFTQLATVNYAPGSGNGTWVELTGLTATGIRAIQFVFGTQQNGYVGYTELCVQGTPATPPLTWTGLDGAAGNGAWNTTSTNSWKATTGPTPYVDGSVVVFDNTGVNTNIAIDASGVAPGGINFNNDAATPYTFTGPGQINALGAGASMTFTGTGPVTLNAFSISGALLMNSGTATLTSINSINGGTIINGGTLNLGNNLSLGVNSVALNAGTLNLRTPTHTLPNFTGTGGTILLGSTSGPPFTTILTLGSTNLATTYGGVIAQAIGATGAVTKSGTALLTLNGASTYTGATTISGGTLRLNGSLAAGSAVSVATGTTLTGTGAANGTVTVNSTAHLAPGVNTTGNFAGIGTLTLGNAVLNSNAILDLDFATGNNSDLIAVTGALTLPAAGNISINANPGITIPNGTFKIFTFASLVNAFNPAGISLALAPVNGATVSFARNGNEIDMIVTGGSPSGGVFSAAALGTGAFDASIGVDPAKTYVMAVNVQGATVSLNGVSFTGVNGGNSSGTGTNGTSWSFTGPVNALNAGGTNLVTGSLGTLLADFIYGGNPTVARLNGLTPGTTYVLTYYNRSYDAAGARVQLITASDGASLLFDEDIGATAQGEANLLRYTFVANSQTEILSFAPQVAGYTMHFYGFSTEIVFTKNYVSGTSFAGAVYNPVGTPGGTGSNVFFPSQATPTTLTMDTLVTLGHIGFDGTNAWTISGSNAVTLQTDVAAVSVLSATGSGAHTISTPVVLGSDAAKLGGGSLRLSGAVTGAGGLIVNTGLLILNAANGYTGATTVNGGTLRLNSADALGTAANHTSLVRVTSGGTLDLNGITTSTPINANFVGSGLAGAGALINNSTTPVVFSGDITSTSLTATSFTVGGTGDITLSGAITGIATVTLVKTGPGTLTLSGLTDNTNFALIVNQGTVVLNKTSSGTVHAINANGNLVNTGATLKIFGSGGDQIADTAGLNVTGTLDVNGTNESIDALSGFGTVINNGPADAVLTVGVNNGNGVFAGTIKDGTKKVAIVKAGGGTLSLANTGNTYTGSTTISSGTLRLSTTVDTSAAIVHYALDGSGQVPNTAGAIVDSTPNPLNGTMVGAGATYVPGYLNQGINFTGSQFVTIADSPDLHLSGAFTVSVWVNFANTPPNGTLWGIMGTRTAGALDNTFDFKYLTLNNVTAIHGDIGNGTAWLTTAADFPVVLSTGNWHMIAYSVSSTGYAIYVDGALGTTGTYAGTPLLMKNGQSYYIGSDYNTGAAQGELMVGSIDDMYVFPTALSAAEVAGLYASGAGKLPTGTAVIMGDAVTLDLGGNSQTIASLADLTPAESGTVTNSLPNTPVTLTLNATSGSTTYLGQISDLGAANALSLVKTGASTQIFSGASSYSGTTAVNGGKLIMDGVLQTGGGAVAVATGAHLRGTGDGTATGLVDRTVNLAAGGFVIPGDAVGQFGAKGKLTVNTLAAPAGTVVIRLTTPAAPTADVLNVTANTPLDLTPATLLIESEPGMYTTTTLNILQTTFGDQITGKFGTVNKSATGVTVQYINALNNVIANPSAGTPANRVQLVVNGAVTPVRIDSFMAHSEGAGILLSWNCVSEFQNAGFNVYRRALSGNDWSRVNPALTPGRITNPDAKSYTLYDWPASGIYEYRLESVSIQGLNEPYAKLAGPVSSDALSMLSADGLTAAASSVAVAADVQRASAIAANFDAKQAPAKQYKERVSPGGGTYKLDESAFVELPGLMLPTDSIIASKQSDQTNASTATEAVKYEGAPVASAASRAASSPLAAGARWFTSTASRAGAYTGVKVTYSKPGVMLIPQSMLPAGFNANRVSITREGRKLTALAATADGVLVFVPGYQDDYTDKDALFLRRTSAPTAAGQATAAQGLFAPGKTVNVESPASVNSTFHDVYFDYNLRPYNFPPWFSAQYLTNGTSQRFTIAAPNASSGAASLSVNVWSLSQGGASPDHALQVLVNDQPAGQASWTGGEKMMSLNFQIPSGALHSGANVIDLVTPNLGGVTSQIALLHSMAVSFTQTLDGSKPVDVFNNGFTPKTFELGNLPSATAWVVDARYADRAALVAYQTQQQPNGSYSLRFNAQSGGTGRYIVVPAGQENLPIAVTKRQIRALKPSAYLAVGPAQFGAGVQPLIAAHSKEGIRGQFADQEALFDFYNNGRFGPAGIQNAVRATRPQYLLLLGRTTYDYKNFSGQNVDPLCPAFLVSTTFWAQTTSDSAFGDLGRGYPEVAVGRLPVNDANELSIAVHRIASYAGLNSGFRAHAVADTADPLAGDFAAQADALAQAHPDIAWQRNYLGVTSQTAPEVTAAMRDAANGGADILLYFGHGNALRLGVEVPPILDTESVKQWTGNVVLLQATCTANWMAKNEDGYKSIAIQALTQPQGGISASIGTSTYMNPEYAAEFMTRLMSNATLGGARWGSALRSAQQWAQASENGAGFYGDLSKTEQLFGDPAMPVGARK